MDEKQRVAFLRRTLTQANIRRELSAQQVASALLGKPNHYTNAKFVNCYWTKILNWLDPDPLPLPAGTYDMLFRPSDLESICLWELLESYEKVPNKRSSANEELEETDIPDDDDGMYLSTFRCSSRAEICSGSPRLAFQPGHPQHSSHFMRKRRKPCVPVFIGIGIPKREDVDSYRIAMLTLFSPWRRSTSEPLKLRTASWAETFDNFKQQAGRRTLCLMDHFEEHHECRKAADNY
ncbi:hypothetical protein K435DRAFT_649721, partial [Dendrothele bispora CBS 962.96]